MKDPRVGSFGTVAVVLALLGKWVALVPLAEWGEWSWVVLAWVVSRVGSVLLMGLLPYARAEGGTAGPFVAGARPWQIGVAFVVMAAITWGLVGFDAWSWAALAVGMLGVVVFGAHCRSRLGGITGDTLGACSEGVEVAILLLGAASLAV
jgi:adenosylcobinamide-GDP ribazoletransferase